MKCNAVWFFILLSIFAACDFLCFAPGLMTNDSWVQFLQALSGEYDDRSPPVMAAWWHVLLHVDPGPLPMLVFHLALFWGAIGVLGYAFLPTHPRLAYGFLLLILLPPLLGMSGVIWKDTGQAVSWMLAASIAVFYHHRRRRPGPLASAVMTLGFLYGMAVRYNAIFGAWPLLALVLTVYMPRASLPRILGLSLIAAIVSAVAAVAANDMLTSRRGHIIQELYLQDLTCMTLRRGESLYPGYISYHSQFDMAKLRRRYPYPLWRHTFHPNDRVFYTFEQDRLAMLRNAWLEAIRNDPKEYLTCRWGVFTALMGITDIPGKAYPYETRPVSDPVIPALSAAVSSYLKTATGWPVNQLWFWLLLDAALLALCLWRRRYDTDRPAVLLTVSSLLYAGGYFFITFSTDLRYVYWSIAATALALMIMLLAVCVSKGKRVSSLFSRWR